MILRKLKSKDAIPMINWMHDKDVVEKLAANFMSMCIDDCLNFINNANENEEINIHRAICDDNDNYLGTVSLKNISFEDRNAEYAIVLSRESMGTGAAFFATKEILKIAFEELLLNRVYLCVRKSNLRARKFYQKVGFYQEGIFREHILDKEGNFDDLIWLSILKTEYENEIE